MTTWRAVMVATAVAAVGGCDDLRPGGGPQVEVATEGWLTTESGSGWGAASHPCVGYRTDALHVDDDGTIWVGCGSTAEGDGLFVSDDGGVSWEEVDDPILADTRVSSIQRAAGDLWLGGIHDSGDERVLRLDTDTMALTAEFSSTGELWSSFHVGTFRRAPSGYAVAESLTGTGLAYRTDDDAPWRDGTGWWPGTAGYQLLDLQVHGGRFYGAGSTIAQPPMVFLPSGDPGDPFSLDPVQLASFEGELWALAVDDGGILAVGVDQQADVGVAFFSDLDGSAWGQLDVADLIGSTPTWLRGACRQDDHLVVVGEKSMLNDGLVFESLDGGDSWSDGTPTGVGEVPALQRCTLLDDGTLLVAGGDGFVGRRFR